MGADFPDKPVLKVPVIDIHALMSATSDHEVEATLQDPEGPFQATIDKLRAAATEWGFFYITNHGIPPEQFEEFHKAVHAFFALPKEIKNTIRRRRDNSRGYFDEELTKNKTDWKEVFDITGPHEDAPPNPELYKRLIVNDQNQWLDEDTLPGFKATINAYYASAEHIARRILQLFAVALGEHVNFFDQFFHDGAFISENQQTTGPAVHRNSSIFRLNHYPVAPEPEKTMGVYHHTDAGALTVLLQDDEVASLQVFHRGSQQWLFVPPIKDTFVINIGDLVQVWSNDKFVAPPHRVLASGSKSRYSAPYFYNPSYNTVIEPIVVRENEKPRYGPLNWYEFLREKIEGNIDDIGEDLQISHFRIHDPDSTAPELPPIPN
uniref:Fe2OG dioxygenase domain-containing protein n=1 Tax=Globisporangium ultimum (strain ATCC 200006 / CBS 805.95 / DAOM BR144) TaxID=431595 RepID=K3WAM8_GLOUD